MRPRVSALLVTTTDERGRSSLPSLGMVRQINIKMLLKLLLSRAAAPAVSPAARFVALVPPAQNKEGHGSRNKDKSDHCLKFRYHRFKVAQILTLPVPDWLAWPLLCI